MRSVIGTLWLRYPLMRILIITNLYPPHTIGGYELACRDVAEGLRRKGHDVFILTSDYRIADSADDGKLFHGQIFRRLHFFEYRDVRDVMYRLWWYQRRDRRIVRDVIRQVSPDLLYIWNLERLSYGIIPTYSDFPIPIVYAISSYWMSKDTVYCDWQEFWSRSAGSRIRRIMKQGLRACLPSIHEISPIDIPCAAAHFYSIVLQKEHAQHGIAPLHSQVIYHGIRIEDFRPPAPPPLKSHDTIKLLYSGQVGQHKGVHTIVDALNILINEHGVQHIHFDIVGPTPFPEYTIRLESAITKHRLAPYVNFVGKVSRRELVGLYHAHDILLFPSIWPEPFSITILEAMAAKLPIIATPTGGSAEILIHGENCLTFPPDDSIALARCIYDLIHDEDARRTIADRASTLIQQQFDIRDIVTHIAEFLDEVCHYYREHENI